MSRKHKHEEHENHERWLVSYADFITLLFAFFVVMYSMSSVNEGKYKVLSESMVAAFRTSARALQPIQVGEPARSRFNPGSVIDLPKPIDLKPKIYESFPGMQPGEGTSVSDNGNEYDSASSQEVEEISTEVEKTMSELIEKDLVTIRRNRLWLEVELNTSFLFASGSATPSIDAEVILLQLARVLIAHPNKLHVEGYTDNRPIQSSVFPSNWELSSARAAAVVRLFIDFGLQPERMASIGYGEYRPIASNDTEAGRIKNRRVVIIVIANPNAGGEEQNSVTEMELLRQRLLSVPTLIN